MMPSLVSLFAYYCIQSAINIWTIVDKFQANILHEINAMFVHLHDNIDFYILSLGCLLHWMSRHPSVSFLSLTPLSAARLPLLQTRRSHWGALKLICHFIFQNVWTMKWCGKGEICFDYYTTYIQEITHLTSHVLSQTAIKYHTKLHILTLPGS